MNWIVETTVVEQGEDWNPVWPEPNLSSDQRLGVMSEDYTIVFTGDGETYTYTTTDAATYMMAQPGSRWELEINQLGGIQSIEPVN